MSIPNRRLVAWIVAGVFVWGLIHACGAYWNYRFGDNSWRVQPAVVTLLFVEGFLAFWLLLLWWVPRSRRRRAEPSDAAAVRRETSSPPSRSARSRSSR